MEATFDFEASMSPDNKWLEHMGIPAVDRHRDVDGSGRPRPTKVNLASLK